MSDPRTDGRHGGIDGDSEINGTAFNDVFLDIVWMALSRDHGEFPLFALFPAEADETVCDDVALPCEPEIEPACEPELEVA